MTELGKLLCRDLGLLDQAHRIPLTRLVCFSEKTFLVLRSVYKGLLSALGRPGRLGRRRPTLAALAVVYEPSWQRLYEPSAMTRIWGLRLGADGGAEGWLRAWGWDRGLTEIGSGSWRRWLAIRG